MKDTPHEPQGGGDSEPEITIVAVANETFYLVEGEEHLNQLLLADGVYPMPVLCFHFESILEIKAVMGDEINMGEYWSIHPEIIKRLRNTNVLIEKAA
jgi:hypothetical protein